MRNSRKLRIASVLAALSICGGAQAALVEVDYSFTITDTSGGFPGPTTIVGEAIFDLEASPTGASLTSATYPLVSHSVSFGGTPITADGSLIVDIQDPAMTMPPSDRFQIVSEFDDIFAPIQLAAIGFVLEGADTTFSGVDLFVPNPSDFATQLGVVVFGTASGGPLGLGAPLSTLQFTIRQTVPEPTTLALIGIGVAGLGFSRRKRSAS